eukprot:6341758-Lingulodinium_polyedra.AAC.1
MEAPRQLRCEAIEDVHVPPLTNVGAGLFRPGAASNVAKVPLGKFPVPADEPLLPALLPQP